MTCVSVFQVTRPHPSDHPLLLLFLVGGVTPSELRLVRDVAAAHKPGSQVRSAPNTLSVGSVGLASCVSVCVSLVFYSVCAFTR